MNDGKLFKDLKLNGKLLASCELALECNRRGYRLYVDRDENCFYSLAISFNSCANGGDVWECPDLEVDELFTSIAYFDGVRHLEFNRTDDGDQDGYIYYPNMQGLIEMLQKVRELELDICRDCDKET